MKEVFIFFHPFLIYIKIYENCFLFEEKILLDADYIYTFQAAESPSSLIKDIIIYITVVEYGDIRNKMQNIILFIFKYKEILG